LQVQHCLQVDLTVEALFCNLQFFVQALLASVPATFACFPTPIKAAAARGYHQEGEVAPEVLLEGLPAFKFSAQVSPPVVFKNVLTAIGLSMAIIIKRLEHI